MQLFRRKSSANLRAPSSELTSSSPPSPSSSQETPSIPHRLFRRKSAANIRSSRESNSSGEAPASIPRRLFRRKSSATIRPSTATSADSPTPSSPHSYTSPASPPPIPAQFVQPLPVQSPQIPTIANLTNTPNPLNPNRISNRFSTTSTLFEREGPAPLPPAARPSPLAQVQQSPIEEYVTQARESDLHRLGHDAMMALAWVQAEEGRRAAASRGWQQDPWRGGFGPSRPAERVRPVPVLRVETAISAAVPRTGTPVRNETSEWSGNGLRERLGRRLKSQSQSIFNLRQLVGNVV